MQREDIFPMSTKELRRLPVIERLAAGGITQRNAAEALGISERQVRRLLGRYKEGGASALGHRSRGRPSSRRIEQERRNEVLELYSTRYAGFGPTFAAEKLMEHEGIALSDETLRKLLIEEGLWKPRRRRKHVHRRRERRECFGELLQMDGSHHDWLEGRGPRLVLMGLIDDASGRVYGRFYDHEGTAPAMDCFRRYALLRGLPMAVYVDRLSAYRGRERRSQFERAMEGLGVEVIHAGSPEAKGRVERSFGTHQDRLVKELRLRGISTVEEANEFLEEYFAGHNERFGVEARSGADAHVAVTEEQLDEHFCLKEERTVRADGTFSFKGVLYMVEGRQRGPVEVRVSLGGDMSITWRGQELDFHAVAERPKKKKAEKKSQAQASVTIPAEDHPWRRPLKRLDNRYVWANAY